MASRTSLKVLVQEPRGASHKAIRRAYLFNRETGLLLETQTLFIDHEFSKEALNTQVAVLADLAFFYEWCAQKSEQHPHWISPERRATYTNSPLSEIEIRDLARWCQLKSSLLKNQSQTSRNKISTLPVGQTVSPSLRNRRIRYISHYLQWITINSSSTANRTNDQFEKIEIIRRQTERCFEKQIIAHAKPEIPRSLNPSQSKILRDLIDDKKMFPSTANGSRDRLIVKLLLQGVRAGELLKTKVADIDDAYEIQIGDRIGVITINRRVNEVEDVRKHEPSVKTRPGILPIPNSLTQELITYITQWRRHAIDQANDKKETPFLFVSHYGPTIGKPISQRNLNRVISKLKGKLGLPKTLTPHTLRHTHFTEIYQYARDNGRSDRQIQDMLILRGRWAPNSKMPAKYVYRALIKEAASFIEARDKELSESRDQ